MLVVLMTIISIYISSLSAAVSSFSPLAHFIPVIEFRDRIDHWKWIGKSVHCCMYVKILPPSFLLRGW